MQTVTYNMSMESSSLVWTHLSGIEVRASQQVLQVDVPLWLGLFQHDHGVGLPEE